MVSWLAPTPRLSSSDDDDDDDENEVGDTETPILRLPAGYAAALGGMGHRYAADVNDEVLLDGDQAIEQLEDALDAPDERGPIEQWFSRRSDDEEYEIRMEQLRMYADAQSALREEELAASEAAAVRYVAEDDEDEEAFVALDSAESNRPITRLPAELLVAICNHFERAQSFVALRAACQRFRALDVPDRAWRNAACSMLPMRTLWTQHAAAPQVGYRALCERLHIAIRQLRHRWKRFLSGAAHGKNLQGEAFPRSLQWTTDRQDAAFLLWLMVAIRMFHVSAPKSYLDPNLMYGDADLPLLSKSAYLAIRLIDRVVNRGLGAGDDALLARIWSEDPASETESHLRSWWGEQAREELLHQLFDLQKITDYIELCPSETHLQMVLEYASDVGSSDVEHYASAAYAEFPETMSKGSSELPPRHRQSRLGVLASLSSICLHGLSLVTT